MKMKEVNSLSTDDTHLEDTNSQHDITHSSKDPDFNSKTNLHHLADKLDLPSQDDDTTGKESVRKLGIRKSTLLICVILLVVIGVMQIPITIFYVNPSSEISSNMLINLINLESCSVSDIVHCIHSDVGTIVL